MSDPNKHQISFYYFSRFSFQIYYELIFLIITFKYSIKLWVFTRLFFIFLIVSHIAPKYLDNIVEIL